MMITIIVNKQNQITVMLSYIEKGLFKQCAENQSTDSIGGSIIFECRPGKCS